METVIVGTIATVLAWADLPQVCRQPNVPALTQYAEPPRLPWAVARYGLAGTVEVVITLDDNSRVTNATVRRSPNARLNAAALDAARRSTFTTEVRNCVPHGGEFVDTVDVESDVPIAYVDPRATPPIAVTNGRAEIDERGVDVAVQRAIDDAAEAAMVLAEAQVFDVGGLRSQSSHVEQHEGQRFVYVRATFELVPQ